MTQNIINIVGGTIIVLINLWGFYKYIKILRTPDDKLDGLSMKVDRATWASYSNEERKRIIKKQAKRMVIGYTILSLFLLLFLITRLH